MQKDRELLRNEYLNSSKELQNQQELISKRIQTCIEENKSLSKTLANFESQLLREFTSEQKAASRHSQYQGIGGIGVQD